MVTDEYGEINLDTAHVVYTMDARFLSHYRRCINRIFLDVVNSSQPNFYATRFHHTMMEDETRKERFFGNTLEALDRISRIGG